MATLEQNLEYKKINQAAFKSQLNTALSYAANSRDLDIQLALVTSSIVEMVILDGYLTKGVTSTPGICDLFSKKIYNIRFRSLFTAIRDVRNNYVHYNTLETELSIKNLWSVMQHFNSSSFKEFIRNLTRHTSLNFTEPEICCIHKLLYDRATQTMNIF